MRKTLPAHGLDRATVDAALASMKADDAPWRQGRTPAYMFGATPEAEDVVKHAYMAFFSENALGAKRAFPSLRRMEQDVVDMALGLFNAPDEACGNMTTGGTESIVLAVKTCRDWTRANRPVHGRPNIVAPLSLHPAFDKAADLMDLEVRRIDLRPDYRADARAMDAAIDGSTMMIVGSAPCFPHGVIDPIAELGAIAEARDLWLHVDACVGGYLAPFVRRAGYPIPDFDFSVPGVRSMSADLHKFGWAAKPASTVFYRSEAYREHQKFDHAEWSSGRFVTETLVGTRPGGAVAAAWALLNHLGEDGYTEIAGRLMRMTKAYIADIAAIDGLEIVGSPDISVISYRARDLDILAVGERMSAKGWLVNATRLPPALHMMMSLLHEDARETYVADLRAAVAAVRQAGTAATMTATY